MTDTEDRREEATRSLWAWRAQIPIGTALSLAAVFLGSPWEKILLVYVTLLSVWTGIESAHARRNTDLPTEEK